MIGEYIKKSTIIKFIEDGLNSGRFGYDGVEIMTEIEFSEPADVQPIVRSKWKLHKNGNGTCMNCNFTSIAVWDFDNWLNFCPHCGADMRGMYDVIHHKEGEENV